MESLSLLMLLMIVIGSVPDRGHCLFLDDEDSNRVVHYIANRHSKQECSRHSSGLDYVTIEGSVKMTTAPPPPDLRRHKICQAPLVPFGKLTQDRRGINFWYLRLKVTQLLPGQFLVVVNTDLGEINSVTVEKDQRIDLTHESHRYPTILYLKYRYARLYWNSTRDTSQDNWVNITVSTYARFNDSVNATVQKELCDRYGITWCERSGSAVCIGPNSCSLQDDCFDSFSDPTICSDALWVNGNLTTAGSSLRTTGWILRNLPWLALGAVPLVLVVALAKICSQKRDLDIDDDYEYKVSYSEHHGETGTASEAGRNGAAVRGRLDPAGADDLDDESSSSSDDDGRDVGDAGLYYSYPSPAGRNPAQGRGTSSPSSPAACDTRTEVVSCDGSSSGGGADAKPEEPTANGESAEGDRDQGEEAPPPPPPRLSQAQTAVTTRNGAQSGSSGSAPAVGGRALHRLTEVSLEEEDEDATDGGKRGGGGGCGGEGQDEEEEEFVNVEYLRQQMLRPAGEDPRVPSGEYTAAAPSDPDESSPRNSYTRLLSQPSPDTIKELLRPPVGDSGGGGGGAGGGDCDSGVVYAQLVLPPPTTRGPAGLGAASEALELQAVRAPASRSATPAGAKTGREPYDLNYIVV